MPMFALFGLVVAACLLPPVADQPSLVGAQAPDFSLQGLDGKEVSLKSLRGHTVVLHFWATYWESCYADMGHLDKLYREFKNQGVIVFGVNVGQLPRVVRDFIRKRGYTYPQLVNARGELILSYQATEAPTVVIIGKDGKIVNHLAEEQGEEGLRSALKKAMQ
jgi:peroxiredoxin